MASTWGNNTWGSNEWQDDVIEVPLTAPEAASALGTPQSFNLEGWGRQQWNNSGWGVEYSVEPTGLEATSSLGTAVHGIGVPLDMVANPPTGDQLLKFARTSVGSVSVAIEEIVLPTGLESTFATPTLSYVGTLVGWGRDAWGDNSWGESPDQVIPAVGLAATASVGAIAPADVVGLSGQEATTNIGSVTFTIDSTPAITGQVATGNVGTLGLEFGPAGAVSGVAATSGLGTLGLEFGPAGAISGVSATTSVGSIEITSVELVDVTGISATTSLGSVVLEIGVPLTGIAATSAAGSLSTITDFTQGLSLDAATASTGILGIQAYGNVDTGSNSSYSNISTGSNDTYSDVATGSNTSYSDAA
jgi:hypothetical protein